jgi:hypothetical protein
MSSAPMPISLSEEQQVAVLRALQPLQEYERSAFLAALVPLLRGKDIGDGELFRLIRALQRELWRPPSGLTKEPQPHRRRVGEPIA